MDVSEEFVYGIRNRLEMVSGTCRQALYGKSLWDAMIG